MGQDQIDVGAKPAGSNAEKLNQVLKGNQFISLDLRDKFMSDAMAPAPESLGQRLMTVTKEAVNQVPQAFVNSFDAKNILPNVGIGFGLGSAMKVALPETGPVGKVVGGALGTWFVGKPLVESYYMAATASTNMDMYKASHHLAETVGGLPVTAAETVVGAKLGTMAAGKFMGSAMAEPLVAWKARQYERLDTKIDSADVALKNAASKDMGLGNKTRFQNRDNAFDDGTLGSGSHYERGHGPNYLEFRSNPPQKAKADDGFVVEEKPGDLSIALLFENSGGKSSAVGTELRYGDRVFTDLLNGADTRGLSFNPKARVPNLDRVELDLANGDPKSRAMIDGVRRVLRARIRAEREMNGPEDGRALSDHTPAAGSGVKPPQQALELNEHQSDISGWLLERHLADRHVADTEWKVGQDYFGVDFFRERFAREPRELKGSRNAPSSEGSGGQRRIEQVREAMRGMSADGTGPSHVMKIDIDSVVAHETPHPLSQPAKPKGETKTKDNSDK